MNIVLTGGGSAGHTVPHLALIPQLKNNFENIYYIGTAGIEKNIISKLDIPFYEIKCAKLKRNFSFDNLKIPFTLISSINESKKILKTLSPDIVFSKGGYVALPVVIACHKLKIPVISHESDLSVGLSNKISSKYCKTVFTSFEETAKILKNGAYSGSPIREELFIKDPFKIKQFYNFNNDKPVILVLGGGSGSVAINKCIRSNLSYFLKHYNFIHICGKNNIIKFTNKDYFQAEYIEDMASAFASCDAVISRAGSNTLFEIIHLQKPSIIIPLPAKVSRGDQLDNAKYFLNKNLIKVIYQENLSFDSLNLGLSALFVDKNLKTNLQNCKLKIGNSTIINDIISTAKTYHFHAKERLS